MAATFSWFLAIRYLVSRKINLIGMIGVALAVWALIVVVAVFSGFISDIRANTKNASPDLILTGLPDDASYAAIAPGIEADPDVVATAPRLRQESLLFPHGRMPRTVNHTDPMPMSPLAFDFVEVIGVDFERETAISDVASWLAAAPRSRGGFDLDLADPQNPLAIDPDALDASRRVLRLDNRDRGQVTLRTPPGILLGYTRTGNLLPAHELSIVAARPEAGPSGKPVLRKMRRVFALAGGFRSKNRVFDQTKALVDIEVLRTSLGHDQFDPDSIDLVTDIGIAVRPGADLDAVAARIADRAGGVGRVLTWEQQNALFLSVVDQERGMMKLILFTVILVSVFLIYATMHMMVTQKIKDIGVLSAMGATRQGVRNVFLLCGVTIAVFGCLGGAFIGWATATWLDEIDGFIADTVATVGGWFGFDTGGWSLFPRTLYALDRIPTEVEPAWVLQVSLGAFAMTLLAAWLPARRAATFEPVRALGYE